MLARQFFAFAVIVTAVGCSKPTSVQPGGPENALTVAREYADTRYGKDFFGYSPRLSYYVEDDGETWKTEIGPAGMHIGGGLQVVIRKRDMKVLSALLTQ